MYRSSPYRTAFGIERRRTVGGKDIDAWSTTKGYRGIENKNRLLPVWFDGERRSLWVSIQTKSQGLLMRFKWMHAHHGTGDICCAHWLADVIPLFWDFRKSGVVLDFYGWLYSIFSVNSILVCLCFHKSNSRFKRFFQEHHVGGSLPSPANLPWNMSNPVPSDLRTFDKCRFSLAEILYDGFCLWQRVCSQYSDYLCKQISVHLNRRNKPHWYDTSYVYI